MNRRRLTDTEREIILHSDLPAREIAAWIGCSPWTVWDLRRFTAPAALHSPAPPPSGPVRGVTGQLNVSARPVSGRTPVAPPSEVSR